MKRFSCQSYVILLLSFLTTSSIFSQVKVYEKFTDFDKAVLSEIPDDSTYVINFWATWCGPCVKELPFFEQLNEKYSNTAFKQILVSLDSKRKLKSKVIPFINDNKIKSEVVLLADGKYNSWIDLVDPRWSGAIPITLILKGEKKLFYEKEFHSMKEIEDELLKLF